MVDVNQIMYDMIRRSDSIVTNKVEEVEEVVDTGLEKTEENIQQIAFEYLDEKGYARNDVRNLAMAKQYVIDSSAGFDTVRIRKVRRLEDDLLSETQPEDLEKLMNICLLDNLMKVNYKMDVMLSRRVEYAVEVVDDITTDREKPIGSLQEFVSFQTLLNRYAKQGYHVVGLTQREIANGGKLMMTGFASTKKQTVVVFEREVY